LSVILRQASTATWEHGGRRSFTPSFTCAKILLEHSTPCEANQKANDSWLAVRLCLRAKTGRFHKLKHARTFSRQILILPEVT
jgi:hypothetical protein